MLTVTACQYLSKRLAVSFRETNLDFEFKARRIKEGLHYKDFIITQVVIISLFTILAVPWEARGLVFPLSTTSE